MSDSDIPQYGDPELLPKPTVVRPVGGVGRQSPYDAKGVLRPEGPRWPAELLAPDIGRFVTQRQWRRRRGDEWTTARERAMILDWLATLIADHPEWGRWEVDEKFGLPRSPQGTIDPFLRVRVYTFRTNLLVQEASISFRREEVDDADVFRSKLALLRQALEA